MTESVHIAVGITRHDAGPDLSARMPLGQSDIRGIYNALEEIRYSVGSEMLVFSNWERTDVHAITTEPCTSAEKVLSVVPEYLNESGSRFRTVSGDAALRVLLEPAGSITPGPTGQTRINDIARGCTRLAMEAGTLGPVLGRRLNAFHAVSDRVHREISVDELSGSIADSAVDIAREIHGDLDKTRGLLIGSGESGELIARQLIDAGMCQLAFLQNRSEFVGSLAARVGVSTGSMDALAEELWQADTVILDVGSGKTVIDRDIMVQAIRMRKRKPVFLLDLAVLSEADADVELIEDVFLYNLDHLENIAITEPAALARARQKAAGILEETLSTFADDPGGGLPPGSAVLPEEFRAALTSARELVLASHASPDAAAVTQQLIELLVTRAGYTLEDVYLKNPDQVPEIMHLLRQLFSAPSGSRE